MRRWANKRYVEAPVKWLKPKLPGTARFRSAAGKEFTIRTWNTADGLKRMLMVDDEQNVYYDTGDLNIGLYVVRDCTLIWYAAMSVSCTPQS